MDAQSNFNLGARYYRENNFSKALFHLQEVYKTEQRNIDVLINMSYCHLQLRDYDNAIKYIEEALKIDTRNDSLYYHLCLTYHRVGNIEKTIKACERALEINPRELNYFSRLAYLYETTNQHNKSLEVSCRGLIQFPDSAPLKISAARSERQLGKYEESFKRLKNISTQETNISPDWKVQYNFELGFNHDKKNSADLAFHHFTEANSIIRTLPSYRRVDTNHSLNLIHNLGKLDFGKIQKIIDISRKTPPPLQPVFFVGFPRSGTTLLQKILDSHHNIKVIEEDNPLGKVTSLIEGEPEKYLESPFLLKKKNIEKLRDIYFSEARKYVPIDDNFLLIDKLPMNIVQIHIIKILFPDAKILLGLRHPCDAILSCFMQNFGVNRAMANMFEFSSIINYYDKTMGLWKIFNNEIEFESHSVRYEDLIENMEEEVRRLLEFLELPWDEEVMNYRQNVFSRGFISTPSYSQVVKPIYKEARYRWHRYAKYFQPYFEKLEPHCKAFGYSLDVRVFSVIDSQNK